MYTIDLYQNRYKVALKKKVEIMRLRFDKCMNQRVFKEPLIKINERALNLDASIKDISNKISKKLELEKSNYSKIILKIDTLSPMKTLARGYSITEKDGKMVKSANDLKTGDVVTLKFADDSKEATIN